MKEVQCLDFSIKRILFIQDHNKKSISAFNRLRKVNFQLNPLFHERIFYLDHKITSESIIPNTSKEETLNKYPVPKNTDVVKRFVAFGELS